MHFDTLYELFDDGKGEIDVRQISFITFLRTVSRRWGVITSITMYKLEEKVPSCEILTLSVCSHTFAQVKASFWAYCSELLVLVSKEFSVISR